jgi:ubiquitin carboxyl-terminal hydrolase 17
MFIKPEELDGEDAYRCAPCLSRVPATKMLILKTASSSPVMKRFSHFTGDKIGIEMQNLHCINMQPYMSQQSAEPLVQLC